MFIDTHTHLYDAQFDEDRPEMIARALAAGVERMYLPNCDSGTLAAMQQLCAAFPDHCFPMMGLHPCSVKEDYKKELKLVQHELETGKYVGVGEIGLDYHWDTTFVAEQQEAFRFQIDWAMASDLPIIIHTRNSLDDGIAIVREQQKGNLKGIFHCFGGTLEEAKAIIDLGFYLGIGGVLTFKNSTLPQILSQIDLEYLVLETDAPYLAPVPYRGKRNESAYIPLIAHKLAGIKNCPVEAVAAITSENARKLFG
jgi:TatD DNase family protein